MHDRDEVTTKPKDIYQSRIQSFRERFGDGHFYFACHAALPLSLTPEFLYCLWANFQRDIHGESLNIPWIAVSDLLLSGLCEEVGHELYELDSEIREDLLNHLKNNPRFGSQRLRDLADFMMAYLTPQLDSPDLDVRDLAKTQKWIVLADRNPTQVAQEIASTLARLNLSDKTEWIRMATLLNALAEPLGDFQSLQIYTCAMADYSRGNVEAASDKFNRIPGVTNPIQIAGINLSIPDTIVLPKIFKELDRLLPHLSTIQFVSVKLDDKGKIIDRPKGQAQIYQEDLGKEISLTMVKIPAGEFLMGSPPSEADRLPRESPQHKVRVPEFYLGQTVVTQEQWQQIMGNNPSNFTGNGKLPVERVSWLDAQEFCQKLSQRTQRKYRLSSEAEWEYACRAGTNTPFAYGNTITTAVVNWDRQKTTPVGSFPPNAFGLYDLHGNVWEWCEDTWHGNYQGAPTDGSAWLSSNDNSSRVLRGGSWHDFPGLCRSAFRYPYSPGNRNVDIGFRVACAAPGLL